MGVDIRLRVPPLHSRPGYPNPFPLAAKRLGRSGRSRRHADHLGSLPCTFALDPKKVTFKYQKGSRWTLEDALRGRHRVLYTRRICQFGFRGMSSLYVPSPLFRHSSELRI